MKFSHIETTIENGGIYVIKLNTPKTLNAICLPMYNNILEALRIAAEDDNVKTVVLSANGRAFCASGDINEMQYNLETYGDVRFDILAAKAAEISKSILTHPTVVIAAVHNVVAGAAFNIVLACDYVVAEEGTKFIQAFVKLGLVPDAGGVYLLSKAVGTGKAKMLALTGEPMMLSEAVSYGIVHKVSEKGAAYGDALTIASNFFKGPVKAYAEMKKLLYISEYNTFEKYLEEEIATQVEMGKSADFKEGVTSFLEKRTPVFTGK